MTIFYDPYVLSATLSVCRPRLTRPCRGLRIVSILVCRFMLSIRAFDSTLSYTATLPRITTEHAASLVLPFGAQPSENLPTFISSFAHPVHVDSPLSERDPDVTVDGGPEWRAIHLPVAGPSWTSPPGPSNKPYAPLA